MSPRRLSLVLAIALVLSACSRGSPAVDPDLREEPPGSAVEAVERLVALLEVPDFESAAPLAVPGQAALASLSEGASYGEVARALREDDMSVAANFWAGFAQGAGSFLQGPVAVDDAGVEVIEGVEFHLVRVAPEGGVERVIYVRESEGFHIDLFASFGGGMAARMVQPVERLLVTQTDDSRLILEELRKDAPSLLAAASNPGLLPQVALDLVRLVEVVTRPG